MITLEIYVNENYEVLELMHSGVNCAQDIIGNYDGMQFFTYNDDLNAYECDNDTFDYWRKTLSAHQELDDTIQDMKSLYGADAVYNAINAAGDYDLEDQPAAYMTALELLKKEKPHPTE